MIETIAFKLIQQYINGWKSNDLSMIISCLAQDCIVIESHGPKYEGVSDIQHWFEFWLQAKSKIEKWDIFSFYFCGNKKTAFVEWDFCCISNDVEYAFPGISVIQFIDEKIFFIHEYRMIHKTYGWKKDTLKSE